MLTGTYIFDIQSQNGEKLVELVAEGYQDWTGGYFKIQTSASTQVREQNIKSPLSGIDTKNQQKSIKYLERLIKILYLDPYNFPESTITQFKNYTPAPVEEPTPTLVEEEPVRPKKTPAQLEEETQQQKAQRVKTNSKINYQKTLNTGVAVTTASQLVGLDKINQTVNTKVEALKAKAISQLFTMGSDLGIQGLDTGNPVIPNICPSSQVLDRVLTIRNNLGTEIENTAIYINIIDNSLNIVRDLLQGTITTTTALTLLKTATSLGVKFAPTVPGAITALLSDLDDIKTLLTFKTDGTPKLPELKRAVDLGATYISQASSILNNILGLLATIDQVLAFCGRNANPNGENTDNLLNKAKVAGIEDQLYRGFAFKIVEEPFSPTVNRKIGQAVNSQGIVLLQTEPSFTADPQVLIEELKFVIDRDNLKGN